MSTYQQGLCSSFLLYSVYAASIPYASTMLVHDLGFDTAHAAQREFLSRLKLLHSLGCETNELAILQGSILLCSFQHFLEEIKGLRYWKCNAIRLSSQLGLRRVYDPMNHEMIGS
jgi:hypothetical protein